jgi:uncharacterized damage-inducible protein DinB
MSDPVQTLRDGLRRQFRDQHAMMRQVVQGLDLDALNWLPGADTNSIAQLLGHALESERFLTATAMNVAMTREREAPFHIIVPSVEDVLALIEQTASELDSVLNHLSAEQLAREVTRTISTGETTRTGAQWLLLAVAHAREHIGQALLTRQLYEQRAA